MKKNLLCYCFITIAFCLLLSTNMLGQDSSYGIRAGYVYSGSTNPNKSIIVGGNTWNIDLKPKSGFEIGIFYKKKLTKIVGFSASIGYLEKGHIYSPSYSNRPNTSTDSKMTYKCINIPLGFEFALIDNFSTTLGVELAVIVGDLSQVYKSDFAGILSFDYNVTEAIGLFLKGNYAFTPYQDIQFTDENNRPVGDKHKYYNYYGELGLAYFFR